MLSDPAQQGESLVAQPIESQGGSRYAVLVVLAVGLAVLTTNALIPSIVGAYVDAYNLSLAAAGLTATVYMISASIAAVLITAIMPLIATRWLVLVSLLLLAVANIASLWIRDPIVILVVRGFAGLGEGAGYALMSAAIAQRAGPVRLFAIFGVGILLFSAGILALLPTVRAVWGPAYVFLLCAIAPILMLPFAGLFPELSKAAPATTPQPSLPKPPPRGMFVLAISAMLTIYVGYGASFAYLERIGVALGYSPNAVAHVLSLSYAVGGAGALAALLTHKARLPAYRLMAALIFAVAAILLAMAPVPRGYAIGVTTFFFTWFYFIPNLSGLVSTADPSGRMMAAASGAQGLGIALGPGLVAGWLALSGQGLIAGARLISMVGYGLGAVLLLGIVLVLARRSPTT